MSVVAQDREAVGIHSLPPEIFSHILHYLVPLDKTINVYRWRRRNYREHHVPTQLLLVSKVFRHASMDLFYAKNIVAFREMVDILYVIDSVSPMTTSHLQFIQITAPYDRFDYDNFADGVEMQSLTGGPIRLMQRLPNLRVLRMQGMGFGMAQSTLSARDRAIAHNPVSGRIDFDAVRLLKIIHSPISLYDGEIYCNGEKKESTIVKKDFFYHPRSCDVKITRGELLMEAERVTRRRDETNAARTKTEQFMPTLTTVSA